MAEAGDALFLCRYPFLPEARGRVQQGGFVLADLLGDPAYQRARTRAVRRVKGSLEGSGIGAPHAANENEAILELLSYPLARALVVTVGDSYLTQRYATAESKLASAQLQKEEGETVWQVATQLGLPLDASPEPFFARLHFLDYLRNAPARDPAWKLVNQPLSGGRVSLAREQVVRLAEEALKNRLLDELDELERPGRALHDALGRELNEIQTLVSAHRARFAPEATGPLRPEAFPPCMQAIWTGIKNHVNVPHMGRFAIVSFLHTLGMTSEDILRFFASVPDFDVNKSRYQIEHITGQIGATQYTPPSCSTMQTYGICPLEERDDICLRLIHHPLSYYRKKLRQLPPPQAPRPAVSEVTPPAAPGGPQPG